jgi:hypothetical protein
MDLLVLCGCVTTGLAEMSSTGFSDRRKAMILLIRAKRGIVPLAVGVAVSMLRASTGD